MFAILFVIFSAVAFLAAFCLIHGVKNLKIGRAFPKAHKKTRSGFIGWSIVQICSGLIVLLLCLAALPVTLLFFGG